MENTMEIHGFNKSGTIDATFDGQRMTVPDDMGNRHRQMIADWEAQGNTIPAYVAPPAPFRDLPRPSFLFMMQKIGITETQVEEIIGQMPEGDERDLALIVFRNQQTFKRDNNLLNTITEAAGLTSEQVDTAWRIAEQLTW
jgi:hypothetical protein